MRRAAVPFGISLDEFVDEVHRYGTAFAHGSLIVYAPYFKEVCISSICGVCYQCRTGAQHRIYLFGKFIGIHSDYRM
jgi:hypothetical protein